MTRDETNGQEALQAPDAFHAIQDLAKAYMPKLSDPMCIQYSSTGLATEAAEVLDLYKKAIGDVLPLDRDRVVEELGDVFYAAGMLMLLEHITIEEVYSTLAAKLHEMYPEGYWSLSQYQAYRRVKHGGQLR